MSDKVRGVRVMTGSEYSTGIKFASNVILRIIEDPNPTHLLVPVDDLIGTHSAGTPTYSVIGIVDCSICGGSGFDPVHRSLALDCPGCNGRRWVIGGDDDLLDPTTHMDGVNDGGGER